MQSDFCEIQKENINADENAGDHYGPELTFAKTNCLYQCIKNLPVKEKRELFKTIRIGIPKGLNENTFFPSHGFTSELYATFYVIANSGRKIDHRIMMADK